MVLPILKGGKLYLKQETKAVPLLERRQTQLPADTRLRRYYLRRTCFLIRYHEKQTLANFSFKILKETSLTPLLESRPHAQHQSKPPYVIMQLVISLAQVILLLLATGLPMVHGAIAIGNQVRENGTHFNVAWIEGITPCVADVGIATEGE